MTHWIADVTWLPAHPVDGSSSMLRYWTALDAARVRDGTVSVVSPLGDPPPRPGRVGRIPRVARRRVAYPLRARRSATPAVHILDQSYGYLMPYLASGTRVVVTAHDVIPLVDPGGMTRRQVERYRASVSHLVAADHIAAVSDYTKRQLIELLDIPDGRISVVPNGVDGQFAAAPARVDLRPQPPADRFKVLSVGSAVARKNLRLLPAMIRHARRASGMPELAVLRAGAPLPTDLRDELVAALGPGGLIEYGRVDDETLAALYERADAVVVPSTLEGFGLPVLEAMAAGTVVLSSHASSLPEVGGDAVRYFDPESGADAGDALVEIAQDDAMADALRHKGRLRADEFTWDRTFAGIASVYDKVFS